MLEPAPAAVIHGKHARDLSRWCLPWR
jgi:hypothetical protein